MSQKRRWCFTLNNPFPPEEDQVKAVQCDYMIFGHEIGAEGTPHLQGYIEFEGGKRMSTLKKLIPRAHFEACKGSAKQNIAYCTKDKTDIFVKGTPKEQGKRTDLEQIAKAIEDQQSLQAIAQEFPSTFIRYNKGIIEYKNLLQSHRDVDNPACIIWMWGATGVGKTRTATEDFESYYIKDGTQWWNGYEQQQAIVIDDFDGKWPWRDLLRLLDRYPYQGQTKGGYVKINSPYIIITASYPPEHYYAGEDINQLMRRLKGLIFHLE